MGRLAQWAAATDWVGWLELGGSLGRGAGDELSDIDAGMGLTIEDVEGKLDAIEENVTRFGPVAGTLRQHFGPDTTHLIVVYRHGPQLSLVVSPASSRSGLPPEATALVDKVDRLATPIDRSRWDPTSDTRREWTFLACITAGDALKHAGRGQFWRAFASLSTARDHYLQLLAADEHVIFPQFGAVSLENAGLPVPSRLADTLIGSGDLESFGRAVRILVDLLQPYIGEHDLDQLVTAIRPAIRDGP
ncbi:hypothetical protein GCM10011575_27110 [Microlunatus endophyticus]|uniref:Uncharacterized protein n=1 Tax=Microlunatus endophyticus TaxID=1716077 RepID=A0A917SBS9_9ACTN|nr:hypothetical protein GCM10011575_27110 [Microlunatus endophyticus]